MVAGERDPSLVVLEVADAARPPSSPFAERYPTRFVRLSARPTDVVSEVSGRSKGGSPVLLLASSRFLLEDAYAGLVRAVVAPRANVKLVAPSADADAPAARDGLGAMRSLPSMTVVAPADGPTVRGAVAALAARQGPAFLQLPRADAPDLTDGTFAVGRANEVRPGGDLALVAYGPLLARAAEVADELARVGVSARVLDVASLKPLDEAAVLRAARDTGAILVAEAAPVATGIGTLVAALTAENYPVPVRRLGLPDVWPVGLAGASLDQVGLSAERLRDEAWELLRLRGKVQ